ncbi:type II toxin-antitoxin system death-on-curing family toxin [Luteimonas yindakuii]|uniref:type II toxin-antitoxin system death-on-curing family toxin n=1 Tax=Luteimonas yindakuii TaxID=2565782 RepID=UPI0010A3889B|nr:type II toxin-antitoxin system death-on-curing family toxin [Luteimonas yindakuii]QCO68000.1 type II toxin-antitoxin system death-on-curing family toxin [Luteimonas yindakuii]
MIWISKVLLLAVHDRQLAEHGGSSGIRDETLLESAIARPLQLAAYGEPPPHLASLAASLAYGIARNHPFVDGNKRTTAVACETFLILNGASIDADDVALYPLYLGLAEGSLDEAGFADWLRRHVVLPPATSRLNEPGAVYQD